MHSIKRVKSSQQSTIHIPLIKAVGIDLAKYFKYSCCWKRWKPHLAKQLKEEVFT